MSKYKGTMDRIVPFMMRPCECFAVVCCICWIVFGYSRNSRKQKYRLSLGYDLYSERRVLRSLRTWGGLALVFAFFDLAHTWYVNQRIKQALLAPAVLLQAYVTNCNACISHSLSVGAFEALLDEFKSFYFFDVLLLWFKSARED